MTKIDYEKSWQGYYRQLMARRRAVKSPMLRAMLARSNRTLLRLRTATMTSHHDRLLMSENSSRVVDCGLQISGHSFRTSGRGRVVQT